MVTGNKEHGSGDAPRCLPCETGDEILRAVEQWGGALGNTGFAAPVVRAMSRVCSNFSRAMRARLVAGAFDKAM